MNKEFLPAEFGSWANLMRTDASAGRAVRGQLPTDNAGRVIAGDIRAETRRALDNLARVLEAAGSSLDRSA